MDLGLTDKTVIVTGGSGGIGRGLVLGFAAEGAQVVIATRDGEKGREVAEAASDLPGKVGVIATDVTDRDAVKKLAEQAERDLGPVDVLVNNAGGVAYPRPFLEKPRDEAEWEIALNIWGVVHCTEVIGRGMVERGRG
ncbi:MAG: SDR family NAD(P)-dependent oxidoreductase, partial [Myxococcota bacterium]